MRALRHFELRSHERGAPDEGGVERHAFFVGVPPSVPYFSGHFDGDPVLPAVAQLDALVLPLVRSCWPALPGLRRATRLKFHRAVAPGRELTLRVERAGSALTVTFSLEEAHERAASGVLHFGEEASS